jgi:AcrR family transcriptional regulator
MCERDRYRVVTSVAHVTGVAHALPPTDTDHRSSDREDETAVVSTGAVIRAVPSVRPEAPVPATAAPTPSPTTPPAPSPTTPPAPSPPRRTRGAGVRERRRQETRAKIVDAAAELFAERGFDTVSVMEIARRAGVVEKTVFNHFPVKEGLVFDADPPIRAALLDAVRRRPAGESVSAAAGSFVVAAVSLLGSPDAAAGVAQMARVIRGSRTLQVREREILGDLTNALAGLIAEETGARPEHVEPWLAAHAVLGLYASLLELARDQVLAGVRGPELSAELRRHGRRGLSLLQFGLAGYAKKLS